MRALFTPLSAYSGSIWGEETEMAIWGLKVLIPI